MKDKFKKLYMDWAKRLSQLSHARRLNVGAVIVKDDTVISYGYNGMPAGWDNDCEYIEFMPYEISKSLDSAEIWHEWPFEGTFWVDGQEVLRRYRLKTKSEVLHAESNALAKLAKSNNSGQDADIFITHSPCLECAKLIYQSGIRHVYYGEHYRDTAGLEFLTRSGIEVSQLS